VSFCSASSASTSAAIRSSDFCLGSTPVTASDGCIAVAAAPAAVSPPSYSAGVEHSLSRDSWSGVLLSASACSTSCMMPTRSTQAGSAAQFSRGGKAFMSACTTLGLQHGGSCDGPSPRRQERHACGVSRRRMPPSCGLSPASCHLPCLPLLLRHYHHCHLRDIVPRQLMASVAAAAHCVKSASQSGSHAAASDQCHGPWSGCAG